MKVGKWTKVFALSLALACLQFIPSSAVAAERSDPLLKAWYEGKTEQYLYMGEDQKVHSRFDFDIYSFVESFVSKNDTMNLYAKITLANDRSGYIYGTADETDHYVTEVESPHLYNQFPNDPEDEAIDFRMIAFGAIRLTEDITDNDTQTYYTSGNGTARSSVEVEEKPFDFGEKFEGDLRTTSIERLEIDIQDYQYMAMSSALTDSNCKDTIPGQILCSMYMELQEGDYLPYGVFYNNDVAYVYQRVDVDTNRLIEYSIQEEDTVSARSGVDAESMYASIPYEIVEIIYY